jgi:hypothetical protein
MLGDPLLLGGQLAHHGLAVLTHRQPALLGYASLQPLTESDERATADLPAQIERLALLAELASLRGRCWA